MRIFFASDLHFDVAAGPRATVALARWVVSEGHDDDVLILGGDYGNDDDTVTACLAHFADFPGTMLGIAGNHDVWVDVASDTSEDRYRRLRDIFEDVGIHALEAEPKIVDGVGFAGAMGWYDYSFRVPSLDVPMEVYERKGFPGLAGTVWNDGRNVNWGRGDPEVTDEQVERLADHLERLDEASSLVVATHHVPTAGLLRPQWLPPVVPRRVVVPRKWLILNTYLGSQQFERLFARYADRIELALCGHIHLAREVERRSVRFVSNGSDHKQKELVIYEDGEVRRKSFAPS